MDSSFLSLTSSTPPTKNYRQNISHSSILPKFMAACWGLCSTSILYSSCSASSSFFFKYSLRTLVVTCLNLAGTALRGFPSIWIFFKVFITPNSPGSVLMSLFARFNELSFPKENILVGTRFILLVSRSMLERLGALGKLVRSVMRFTDKIKLSNF